MSSKIIIEKKSINNNNIVDDKQISCPLNNSKCQYNINGKTGTIEKKDILKNLFNPNNNNNILDEIVDSPFPLHIPNRKISSIKNKECHLKQDNDNFIDFNVFKSFYKPKRLKNKNIMNILTNSLSKENIFNLKKSFNKKISKIKPDSLEFDLNIPVSNIRQPDMTELLVPISSLQ